MKQFKFYREILLMTVFAASLPMVLFGQETNGKTPQVWSVQMEGNTTFSDIRLENQIATEGYSFMNRMKFWNRSAHKLNKIEIKKDVIRIRNFYHRHGFPDTKVHYRVEHAEEIWQKRIVFVIDEGAPIRIQNVTIDLSGKKMDRKAVRQSSDFKRLRRNSEFQAGKRYQPIKKNRSGLIIAGCSKIWVLFMSMST